MRSRRGLGLVVIGIALLINRRVLGSVFAADGTIESGWLSTIVLGGQVLLAAIGMALVLGRGGRMARRVLGSPPFLAVAAVTVSLVATEGLVRLVKGPLGRWAPMPAYVGEYRSRPSLNFLADSSIGWTMRPDHRFEWVIDGRAEEYQSNGEGFRSPHSAHDFEEGSPRIVLLGDSFAWGTGVSYESTFGALVQDALGGDAVVYNMAQPGFGVDQMWMTLRHRALPLGPDLVIVAFIDRDFTRSLTAFRQTEGMAKPTFVLTPDGLRPRTEADRPSALVRLLERQSAVWGLVAEASMTAGLERPVGRWWRLNAAILDQISREAAEAGAAVLFVRLPTVDARPFPQLAEHLVTSGRAYVDLGSERVDGIHFETDDHINAAGHRHVADAILPTVRGLLGR